jgi:hypothetical protein
VNEENISCENPNPEKQGTKIALWKFEMVRDAILSVLADSPGGVTSTELMARVRETLQEEEISRLGSVAWHTTVVKLHLESTSVITRDATTRPSLFRKASEH